MIDRSKPLPIHEFPNLISEVARLKELAKKEASATYTQAGDEFGYECAVLNAAPTLLDILGEIRAGDVRRFDEIIEMIDFSMPSELMGVDECDEEFDLAPSEYQEMIRMKETLHRYRGIAKRMKANR
jgi:hypothetical protein